MLYYTSLVLMYVLIMSAFMLLADALRRIYINLKDNAEIEVNKRMMLAYFVSFIYFSFSASILLVLEIIAKYN